MGYIGQRSATTAKNRRCEGLLAKKQVFKAKKTSSRRISYYTKKVTKRMRLRLKANKNLKKKQNLSLNIVKMKSADRGEELTL